MKNNKLSFTTYKIGFILLFLSISVLLHFKSYKSYPSSVHAWAQSDHYAIALGFLDTNFDFFHPKTFSLSHQFPANEKIANPQGITAVDFPLIHYVTALGMKVFHTKEPWVFRLTSWLFSFIALFFLFTTLLRIKNVWTALSVVFFIMMIPIYTYYQDSFMPSAAAFNSLLIGISFILRFYFTDKKRFIYLGVFFMTLAALMRFTEVIFLIALTGAYFLEMIKNRKINIKFIVSFIGLLIVGSYFYYNQLLAQKYGSVFLNTPITAGSFKELVGHLIRQGVKYGREFLTLFHLAILAILIFLYKKQRLKDAFIPSIWVVWIALSTIGVVIFNLLMSYHMSGHDYYALDTWIPLLSLALVYLIINIDFSKNQLVPKVLAILIITGSLSLGIEKQLFKHKYVKGTTDQIIKDFKESQEFLDEKTTHSKKILIICANGWNAPMIGWNKDVYRIAWNFKEQIPQVLDEDYDIIITHNASYEDTVLKNMPDFDQYFQKIADNSLVSVWNVK